MILRINLRFLTSFLKSHMSKLLIFVKQLNYHQENISQLVILNETISQNFSKSYFFQL